MKQYIWEGGKTFHLVFKNLSRSLLQRGAGKVTLSPSPLPYFPADPWIFHGKTTWPLFSSSVFPPWFDVQASNHHPLSLADQWKFYLETTWPLFSSSVFPPWFDVQALKGPKREIFGLGIFAQIRPIWIGYLGTRPKKPKKLRLGPYIALYFPRFLCQRCRRQR